MITVLADDLSGAAEAAGACHARGLSAEVQIAPRPTAAHALSVDADTRNLAPEAARERAATMAQALRSRPARLFKKVDSVLRGPVAAEVAGLLRALDLPRALLVPANPSRGRVIRAGRYFIGGQPLDQSEFAHDPEHPRRSAEVLDLLGEAAGLPLSLARPGETLPPAGLIVGEAESPGDLAHWAGRLDTCTLPCGAAEFLEAWLLAGGEGGGAEAHSPALPRPARALIVSGTASPTGSAFCREAEARGAPVLRMPPELFAGPSPVAEARWEAATRRALAPHPLVVVAIDQPLHPAPDWPARLRAGLAALVASVLAAGGVDQLYVEGGATARAIVERLGWVRLRVQAQLAPGLVALQPLGLNAPLVILKPGSYPWPEFIKDRLYAHSASPA